MRTVPTDRFGELTVDEGEIIRFPDGLVGFATFVEAVLIPVDDDGLFFWLQAAHDPALAFLATVPWTFFPDYEPELASSVQDSLGLVEPSDAMVLCLVTIHDEPRRFTANLLGPVVVNQRTRVARQVVLDHDLPTRAELPSPV